MEEVAKKKFVNKNFKAYFFVNNNYLKEVQWGIQSLHCTACMFGKYREESPQKSMLFDWLDHDGSVVLLDGGNHDQLQRLSRLFDTKDNIFPWQFFREDYASMNNCVTSVGIIVPARIHDEHCLRTSSTFELILAENIINGRTAR